MPVQQEFQQLGLRVPMMPRRGTGPLLQRRIGEAKKALKKTRTIPGSFNRKATVAAVMIVAAALFGVEPADISSRDGSSLESAIMGAIWGPSSPCMAKKIVSTLLLPGHRVAPSMVIPYSRMCWLAHLERRAPLLRETLPENQLTALEKRRPRTFGGMGARLDRALTLSNIATYDKDLTSPCSQE